MTMYFLLLAGCHQDERRNNYEKGDVVSSEQDLQRLFGSDKFRRIPDEQAKQMLAQQKNEQEERNKNAVLTAKSNKS